MGKKVRLLIVILGGIIIIVLVYLTNAPSPKIVDSEYMPDARTLYTGYVLIDEVTLEQLKSDLDDMGCLPYGSDGETISRCRYQERVSTFDGDLGIEVHPRGFGFGPLSFFITPEKLWAIKDIPGPPDIEKFSAEVRQDVAEIDHIVKLKEESWKITGTTYPWTVIY